MKSSSNKCHLLISTNDNITIRIENFQIENINGKKVLGNKLFFDYHLSEIYKKASKRFSALGRVTLYMNLSKRKISTHNSVISHLYGCVVVASLTKK